MADPPHKDQVMMRGFVQRVEEVEAEPASVPAILRRSRTDGNERKGEVERRRKREGEGQERRVERSEVCFNLFVIDGAVAIMTVIVHILVADGAFLGARMVVDRRSDEQIW